MLLIISLHSDGGCLALSLFTRTTAKACDSAGSISFPPEQPGADASC
jgi:hypothetical protein